MNWCWRESSGGYRLKMLDLGTDGSCQYGNSPNSSVRSWMTSWSLMRSGRWSWDCRSCHIRITLGMTTRWYCVVRVKFSRLSSILLSMWNSLDQWSINTIDPVIFMVVCEILNLLCGCVSIWSYSCYEGGGTWDMNNSDIVINSGVLKSSWIMLICSSQDG